MSYCCLSVEPERVHSLHCRPQSSTSISCSWSAPEADYDSYNIECLLQSSQILVYSRRTGRESTTYIIPLLEPHKRYTVSVKVISDSTTSEEAWDSVVTMIDRKGGWRGTCSAESGGFINSVGRIQNFLKSAVSNILFVQILLGSRNKGP